FEIGDMVRRGWYEMDIMFGMIGIDERDEEEGSGILDGNEVRVIGDGKMWDLVLIEKEEEVMMKWVERKEMMCFEVKGSAAEMG
ncbi:sporulation peptidase YabG, partial [Bacillus sp. WP8]|uniref:sporulation peptidase YabG n=1 Tax=Bacillus sp. WP8 TaxID=756828 RepID=UPI0028CB7235